MDDPGRRSASKEGTKANGDEYADLLNGSRDHDNVLTPIADKSKRIGLVYVVLSVIWIIVSDQILERVFFSSSAIAITHWQTVKGTLFIGATAGLLYLVARRLTAAGERVRSVFQAVFENAAIGILTVSRDGRVLQVNPSATRVSGYSPSEVIGKRLEAHCHHDDVPALLSAFNGVSQGYYSNNHLVVRYICKRSSVLWLRVTLSRVQDPRTPLVVVTIEDITRERAAEDALRQSELRLHQFVESDLLGIVFWNGDGTIKEANNAYLKLLGYTRDQLATGQLHCAGLLRSDEGSTSPVGRARISPFETHLIRSDGERVPVLVGGFYFDDGSGDAVAFILDTSPVQEARRKSTALEEELKQAQKLQALGRLAGAISHDMNNLLSIIMGHTALIEAAVPAEDPVRNRTQQILLSTEKGAALVRQLLTFSRQQVPKTEHIDINRRVEADVSMLRPLIGESIQLKFVAGPNMPAIEVDPVQFDQVLLNLVLNARDAMPSGGDIKIETALLSEEDSTKAATSQRSEICVSVSDTGKGMDESIKEHLFEPFFTTKEQGHGTGLGLATVYGIVSKAGGRIAVESEPEKGSTFKVYLPRTSNVSEAAAATKENPVVNDMAGTILLAEDKEPLRLLLKELLESIGFRVLDCVDGQDAIEKAASFEDRVDLILTDVSMPRIGGVEAAETIRHLRPDTKVLFITGYMDETVPTSVDGSELPLLLKPFTPEELARKVREMLSDSAASKKPRDRRRVGKNDFRAA
jgi:two-component system cell cycle sensor histidine kinase/response regulator CckA